MEGVVKSRKKKKPVGGTLTKFLEVKIFNKFDASRRLSIYSQNDSESIERCQSLNRLRPGVKP